MLYRIIDPDRFAECIQQVQQAFWPGERFMALRDRLPSDLDGASEDKILEKTAAALKTIAETVAAEPHYLAIDETGRRHAVPLPFLDRYYRLFLQRKWEQPYADPQAAANDLFRLGREITGGNYSRNVGIEAPFNNRTRLNAIFLA